MLDFGIKDAIDILLVAVALFFGHSLMKKSRSVNIFYGVLVFISIWILVSKVLEMKLPVQEPVQPGLQELQGHSPFPLCRKCR